MQDNKVRTYLEQTNAPSDYSWEFLDVRDLPPPEPLTKTLEVLESLDGEVVLIQLNDRAPQYLYPKLTDRGYEYDTIENDDNTVVTTIWEA
ncbi:MAG: DUF2249 domain-containing protein [Halobacteriaceae archaeon]